MAKGRTTVFFCQNCGHESAKWMGQCSGCGQWNTFVEETIEKTSVRRIQKERAAAGPVCLSSIDTDKEMLRVAFDDGKIVDYDFSQLEELELAYAITIHKSQGSEYPVVILPVYSGPPMLMTRNLLYTAITRAKKLVVLVGLRETVSGMIRNNREISRYTGLAYRIRNLYDFMHGEGDVE